MGVIEGFGDAERHFPLPIVPRRSSCPSSPPPSAGRGNFPPLASNLPRVDLRWTHRLRGTCQPSPTALQPARAVGSAGCAVPVRAARAASAYVPARVAPAAGTSALGRAALVGECLRSGERAPVASGAWGAAARAGSAPVRCAVLGRNSPRPPSLFLSAGPSDSCGARQPLPSGRVTASVGMVCCGFAVNCRGPGCGSRTSARTRFAFAADRALRVPCGLRRKLQLGPPTQRTRPGLF
ncbi:hypothetical protein H8959_017782 [Pygathrix nigripes]